MGFLSLVGIGMIASHSSFLWEGFYQKAITLVFGSFISGILSLVFLWKKRATVAVILSGLAVATVLWGLSYSLFPYLIPPYLTLYETKAPDVVLWTMIGMISFGSVVLFPSLIYLFYLFKKKIPEERLGKCF
jgi:cytochrome d ubiquinol oxidase subunit II